MKPSGQCAIPLENKGGTTLDADRCTSRCTETPAEHDAVAAAVRLVAGLPLTDADRAAILARLVERTGRTPPS